MDALALAAFNFLKIEAGTLPLIVSIITVIVAGYVYLKNVNIKEVTSIGEVQAKNIKLLMEQVEILSEQLKHATYELTTIRKQNTELNTRIMELESIIRSGGCDCGKYDSRSF
jgi:C4-dicarboxylate transporter